MKKNKYLQLVISLAVLAAAVWFFRDQLGFFRSGIASLRTASPLPLVLAVCSALLTLVAMGLVMHTLLRSAGVDVRRRATVVLTFIGNAWSTTFPGGGALSAAYQYNTQRSWGASRLVCGWFIVFSGTLSNVWLAGLGIVLLLAVVTGSVRNLVLVLVNLPFAFVGGVLAVFVTGAVLSLGSIVGFVTLFGISLRNTIMMISHYEHLVTTEGRPSVVTRCS